GVATSQRSWKAASKYRRFGTPTPSHPGRAFGIRRASGAPSDGKWSSEFMAHVGDELRLVLARDLEFLDGLCELPRSCLYFLEEARIVDRELAGMFADIAARTANRVTQTRDEGRS